MIEGVPSVGGARISRSKFDKNQDKSPILDEKYEKIKYIFHHFNNFRIGMCFFTLWRKQTDK